MVNYFCLIQNIGKESLILSTITADKVQYIFIHIVDRLKELNYKIQTYNLHYKK